MKKLVLLLLAVAGLSVTKTLAQMDDASMKAMQAYMTPGDMQKMLAKSDGNWNADITMWMDPTGAPTKTKGTCVNRMILGGRYQESINKSTFNGMPFEGRSLVGYDNAKKVFVYNWIDNMGTGMMTMEGKWNAATKTVEFMGTMVDPSSGNDMKVRETFQLIDNDHQKMEMYMVMPGGQDMKTMEITFTRAKK
ncbi:DUF1579 domain-containing protein [Taibaiella soli]|uniref:DUF1579 domain-containing protein n=1 Tax=Taibaiella soli TaxID=1649169 RepID=A0A2W2B2Y0_9BACT|nr:DUF1579 domain-containing protein [Taibaiella soli]PZF74408.1 hypothetical protein DN068_02175 [Taibaiella soli]